MSTETPSSDLVVVNEPRDSHAFFTGMARALSRGEPPRSRQPQLSNTPWLGERIVLADFNGDGIQDFAISNKRQLGQCLFDLDGEWFGSFSPGVRQPDC